MSIETLRQYRLQIIAFCLVVVFAIVGYLIFRPQAYIEISVPEDARVYIARNRGGEFREISKGPTTYKTREEGPVYIEAVADNGISQSSSRAVVGETRQVAIDIKDTLKNATRLFDGSVESVLIEGANVYGIDPASKSFISFKTNTFATTDAKYLTLPFLKDVIWTNSNNFLYLGFDGRLGLFRNGKDTGIDRIAIKQIGGYQGDNTAGRAVQHDAMFKYPNKPLVLVGPRGLFTSTDNAYTIKHIADVDRNGQAFLSADSKYIYYAKLPFPGEYADEYEAPDGTIYDAGEGSETASITLSVYSYSGDKIGDILVNSSGIDGVVDLGNSRFAVATGNSVSVYGLAGEVAQTVDYYFPTLNDVAAINDSLFMITSSGLWNFDNKTGVYYLVYEFQEGEGGLTNSLQLSKGRLLFGTVPNGSDSQGATYSLDISQWQ